MSAQLPDFATNHDADGRRVADEVNRLFALLRENKLVPPPLAIATAYINPGGFALLADELGRAPHVRLLLGAEPEEDSVRAMAPPPTADYDDRLSQALATHDAWIRLERDSMGFDRQSTTEARSMVAWLESEAPDGAKRVAVRRYTGGFLHGKAYIVEDTAAQAAIAGSSNMTFAGLAFNAELNLGTGGGTPAAGKVLEWFDHYWLLSEPYDLAGLYSDLWEPHTPYSIFMRMLWELYGANLDEESATVPTGLRLTRFQADGVARMKRLLDELGGVLVADEVGLGKTFLAGEVIKQANDLNRQRVLLITPASLKRSVWEPFLTRHGISRLTQVYSYEEVRNRLDPDNPGRGQFLEEVNDYAMVVIDEAHNLRNAGAARSQAIDQAILGGANPKKVVLLTATPVNNSLTDLETLVRYFVRDDARFASVGIPSIHGYIKQAQSVDPENLTPEHLFDLMDQVAVRRTRRFIKEHYPNEQITGPGGQPMFIRFPDPDPRRIDYALDQSGLDLVDKVINALTPPDDDLDPSNDPPDPDKLRLARYTPSAYLKSRQVEGYQLTNAGLLRSALLKRLESSPQALISTLVTLIKAHETFIGGLHRGWVLTGDALSDWASSESDDLDSYVASLDEDAQDQASSIASYDAEALTAAAEADLELLRRLLVQARACLGEADVKAATLIDELTRIAAASLRIDPSGIPHGDRRKVLVFSTFSDTILALHGIVSQAVDTAPEGSPLALYRGRIAPAIMGAYASVQGRGESGGVDQGGRASVIEGFAPKTASRLTDDGQPTAEDRFDLLLTTDVLSEGVNLQQAGEIINYDLPWNPMRIVQRHGRIDRIGSQYDTVHLGLFFPGERLDEMLGLEDTLRRKLAQANAAVGTGEVLPGMKPSADVVLTDPDQAVDQIADLLRKGGASAALSGEEFRRRLYRATISDHAWADQVKRLPYGSGSGFASPNVEGNGYVFCICIADHPQPWFRYVRCDEQWNVACREDGQPLIYDDTLTSLVAADPGSPEMERLLPDGVYEKAFDAWQVARQSAWDTWTSLTDPANLEPAVPKAFRDASTLVFQAGGFLGPEQNTLRRRLGTVPPASVARKVRQALNDGTTDEQRITLVKQALDEAGIQATPPPTPLPYVEIDEVRLVTWMAITSKA